MGGRLPSGRALPSRVTGKVQGVTVAGKALVPGRPVEALSDALVAGMGKGVC